MSRNAVAAKRRKQKIKDSDFQPGIASGLTFGASAEEALREGGKKIRPLRERLGHMNEAAPNRVRFVAEPNEAIVNMGDDRKMQDVDIVMSIEDKRQMQAGYKCLRCFEPLPTAFPARCDLCGYPVRDRQIMDIALEFEGEKHLGPRKPIGEYQDEQDARVAKRKFLAAVLEGKQGWKTAQEMVRAEPILLQGFTPSQQQALRGH